MHGDQPAGHAEPRVRSVAINFEDALWVAGMDLLRRAYVKIVPETAPFFVTGHQGEIEQRSLAAALVAFFNAGPIGAAFHRSHRVDRFRLPPRPVRGSLSTEARSIDAPG